MLPPRTGLEQHSYFAVSGAHIYTVLHQVPRPVARVFLVGPFASERQFCYSLWVRWARYLSERHIEVLRFDYRGVGESTGSFEEAGFEDWNKDVDLLASWFQDLAPDVPLILHGVEIGALFAAERFRHSAASGLLLWSPPESANHALRATLRRWAGVEQLFESPGNRKSALQYIRELEQGLSIEVHGYGWSSRLWQESLRCIMPIDLRNAALPTDGCMRRVKIVSFGKDIESLVMPYRRYEEGQDHSALYSSSFEWITGTLNSLYPSSSLEKSN